MQKTLNDFSIVPILYGQTTPELLANAISPILERDNALLIISADLSHYLSIEDAKVQDSKTINMVFAGENFSFYIMDFDTVELQILGSYIKVCPVKIIPAVCTK